MVPDSCIAPFCPYLLLVATPIWVFENPAESQQAKVAKSYESEMTPRLVVSRPIFGKNPPLLTLPATPQNQHCKPQARQGERRGLGNEDVQRKRV